MDFTPACKTYWYTAVPQFCFVLGSLVGRHGRKFPPCTWQQLTTEVIPGKDDQHSLALERVFTTPHLISRVAISAPVPFPLSTFSTARKPRRVRYTRSIALCSSQRKDREARVV